LSADAREAVGRARAVVDEIVAGNKLAYAITTGVGKLSDVRIAGDQIRELQVNLVRSHAVGVGEPLSVAETRAMMLLRANSLAKGHSRACVRWSSTRFARCSIAASLPSCRRRAA
jgi:histidine ammonia-lyase